MPIPASRLATTAALLVTLLAAPALADDGSAGADQALVLPRALHGQAALTALGAALPVVAAHNDLTATRLRDILLTDDTAWISATGQMFYVELPALDISPGSTEAGSGTPQPTKPLYPTSQTFALHSRPTSTKTIFLDFDGATIANTAFNTGSTALANATYTGYDSDGHNTSFSTAEDAWIQEVWRQVSEMYAPFDIDVTTQDEGSAAYTRSSSSDNAYGTHVVFSNSPQLASAVCNSTCLGIAYVGVFDSVDPVGIYQPAFVFTDPTMSATIAAQGAEHEVGHTLGLHHDGTSTSAYYPGTRAWGPVMGSAFTRAVTQFSQGEYADANNTEDDLAIMQSHGGALRPDDYGNTPATAQPLGTKASYSVKGVITSRTDVDEVAINLGCTTTLNVSAKGIGAQSALDLQLNVLDSMGKTVVKSAPASSYTGTTTPVSTGMDASAKIPNARGTYYLRVDGVGNGNPKGPGWSDYGSLGQYTVTANGCVPGAASASAGSVAITRPGPPRIRTASTGAKGGTVTATARWAVPTYDGNTAITKYRVIARRLDSKNKVVQRITSGDVKASARLLSMRLPKGRYKFQVVAWNKVGASTYSGSSNIVTAR